MEKGAWVPGKGESNRIKCTQRGKLDKGGAVNGRVKESQQRRDGEPKHHLGLIDIHNMIKNIIALYKFYINRYLHTHTYIIIIIIFFFFDVIIVYLEEKLFMRISQ